MGKKKIEFLNILFGVVVYFALTATISFFSMNYRIVEIAGSTVEVGRILSLITVIQILVTIFMTIYGNRPGYITASALLFVNMGFVLMGILRSGNLGSIPGFFMSFEAFIIITIIHSYNKRIKRIANTDMLTNLNNRRALVSEVERMIERNKRFAFILIDLDDFKQTNDLLGHNMGDDLLQQFAAKWSKRVKAENASIARLGGDEFVILMKTKLDKEEFKQFVKDNIVQDDIGAGHTYKVGGEDVLVTVSIGVSMYPDDANNYTDLYRYADMAMYHVKNKGKQNVEVFQSIFLNSASGNYLLEQQIRNALQNEGFYAVFQPQFNTLTEELTGAEALARMIDANGDTIAPYHFIPVAEETKMIVELDFYILERALREFRPFLAKNDSLILSVNFSVKTIFSKDFVERLKSIIERTGFPAKNLKAEITESILISASGQEKEKAIQKLTEIKKMGLHIALDDFGTGYSSLSYLMDLPIDTLKIDKSFIDRLSDNEEENSYIKAVISMGHILKHDVVAEGIETRAQLDTLKNYECDTIQGYLLGKPIRSEEFANIL